MNATNKTCKQREYAMNYRSKTGFTLVELLVVIAIIGVLMGLLFPALSAARHRARVTRAKMEMKQIETAWISYRNDHRTLPTGITRMDANAVRILAGQNPREIAYMEFSDVHNDGFKDPWGEVYLLALARDADPNFVRIRLGTKDVRLNRPVALVSTGSEKGPISSW